MSKKQTIILKSVKNVDAFQKLLSLLCGDNEDLKEKVSDKSFEHGEYSDLCMECFLNADGYIEFRGFFRACR